MKNRSRKSVIYCLEDGSVYFFAYYVFLLNITIRS